MITINYDDDQYLITFHKWTLQLELENFNNLNLPHFRRLDYSCSLLSRHK